MKFVVLVRAEVRAINQVMKQKKNIIINHIILLINLRKNSHPKMILNKMTLLKKIFNIIKSISKPII